MLYIIGIGLNEKSISLEALETLKKCKQVYLDNYTINLPYSREKLEKIINKKIIEATREIVESNKLIELAKNQDIALLVYGSPLFATTHISLIEEARRNKIKTNIIYNASIFDAISETGLQLYKFGKIASMPDWEDKGKSYSFIDIVKDNMKIDAHSLILVDIDLSVIDSLNQLEKAAKKKKVKISKLIICEKLGNKESKIHYGTISELMNKKIKAPFCLTIPGKLHFLEEDIISNR